VPNGFVATPLGTGVRPRARQRGQAVPLLALVWLVAHAGTVLGAPPPSCPLPGALGAPACNAPADVGSVPPTDGAEHVGNPIEVASGNKYEGAVDYRSISSPLAFVRHYNSALADENRGLGHGWRHGLDASLSRVDEHRLLLVQGDGRRIAFDLAVADDGTRRWHATDGTSGTLEIEGNRYVWLVPDGRRLVFAVGRLLRVEYPGGEFLELAYSGGRLVQVSDEHGVAIELVWSSGDRPLSLWGADPSVALDTVPAGHLAALVLPDGSRIAYRYSGLSSLVAVHHESEGRTEPVARYRYADPVHPYALTSITRHHDGPINEAVPARRVETRRWRYDAEGLAVAQLDAQGGERFTIERRNASPDEITVDAAPSIAGLAEGVTGTARVEHRDGRVQRHAWTAAANTGRRPDGRIQYKPTALSTGTGDAAGAVDDRETAARRRESLELLEALQPVANSLDATLPAHSTGASAPLRFRATRDGRVLVVDVGDTSLERLQTIVRKSGTTACDTARRASAAPPPSPAERIDRLAGGAAPCLEDLVWLETLRADAADYAHDGRLQRRGNLFGRDPYCELPGSMDCTQLRDVLDMAMLSDCVYDRTPPSPCAPGWNPVDPTSLGLNPQNFSIGRFHSQLFRHGSSGRFVLVFRGTDQVIDLADSVGQIIGITPGQFSRAADIADRVRDRLALHHPGSTLAFSGHSMGGGLATFAAMHERDRATVFNPSAVTPLTAAFNRFTYFEANNHVEVVRVRGEFLSVLQSTMPAPGNHTPIAKPHNLRFWDTVDAHYMTSVLDSLRTYLARHCP